jgi:CBS domain containing-hemolysin-like protein
VDYRDRRLTVEEMDGRRISRIRVEPLKDEARVEG